MTSASSALPIRLRPSPLVFVPVLVALAGLVAVAVLVRPWSAEDGHESGRATNPDSPFVVAIDYDEGFIRVIDPAAGRSIGQVNVGYQTAALLRPSANQLLVAEAFGAESDTPTLQIYDLADLTAPPRVVPMPERSTWHFYTPAWALSDDERYLYYTGREQDCTRDSPADGNCDAYSIHIVDLESGRAVGRAETDFQCMPISAGVTSSSAVLLRCQNGFTAMEARSDGSIAEVARFPAAAADTEMFIGSLHFARDERGRHYVVYDDGGVLFEGDEDAVADLLPGPDEIAGYQTGFAVGHSSFLFGFGSSGDYRFGEPLIDGVIVFDRRNPGDFQRYDLPFEVIHVAPIDEAAIALLTEDFEVIRYELATAELGEPVKAPLGAQFLYGD